MVARTHAQKFVTLRGQFEATELSLRARRVFPNEREERQVIGRYQTLAGVANDLAVVNEYMKPAQFQPLIEGVLDRLGEQKASWMVNYIRERQKHGINQLGEWMAEGAIAQIDEVVRQLMARLSLKWHTSSTKMHGRYFHVYHSLDLDTMSDTAIGMQRWLSPECAQWYQEVAIIQVAQPEHQLEEVFRLTNHIDRRGWHESRGVMWIRKAVPAPTTPTGVADQGIARLAGELNPRQVPRSTSVGDVFVSVLSGAAWMVGNVGWLPVAHSQGSMSPCAWLQGDRT